MKKTSVQYLVEKGANIDAIDNDQSKNSSSLFMPKWPSSNCSIKEPI